MAKLTRTRTLALGLAGVGIAGAMAGLGTFATFTGTTSASQTIASGTVNIALGTAGSTNNRLTIGASGLVPGDSLQRHVTLSNTGTQNVASIVLTTAASSSSLLDTDASDGLQMKIEKCVGLLGGWTETAVGSGYTYTCDLAVPGDGAGTKTTILASRAVIGSDLALAGLSSLTSGSSDELVVTLTLPSTADNDFQGLSSTVGYTFTATQRAATSK